MNPFSIAKDTSMQGSPIKEVDEEMHLHQQFNEPQTQLNRDDLIIDDISKIAETKTERVKQE